MTDFNFSYAAGKVPGALSGLYSDVGNTLTGSTIAIYFNADGTFEVTGSNVGTIDAGNWYTGGVPTGTTNFTLVVSNTSSTSGTTGPADGTYNYTNSFSIVLSCTISGSNPRFRSSDFNLTVTRSSQSVSYGFSASAEIIP